MKNGSHILRNWNNHRSLKPTTTPLIPSNTSETFFGAMSGRRGAKERRARPDDHQEPGVGRTNCRSRHVGSVHSPRLLLLRRRPDHRARAQRMEDVHPQNKWHRHRCREDFRLPGENRKEWASWRCATYAHVCRKCI